MALPLPRSPGPEQGPCRAGSAPPPQHPRHPVLGTREHVGVIFNVKLKVQGRHKDEILPWPSPQGLRRYVKSALNQGKPHRLTHKTANQHDLRSRRGPWGPFLGQFWSSSPLAPQ